MEELKELLDKQKEFFLSGKSEDINYRIESLKKLKRLLKEKESDILDALKKDLGKSHFEGYATELGLVYEEINYAVKHVKSWSKKEKIKSPIIYYPSKSYIYKEPYGVALIIGPFNYPFQLVMAPLIGAISAGNCAIIKPSEHSINTSKVLETIINENFKEEFIKVVNPMGGKELVTKLLDLPVDYIFFTGSVRVGKIVMEKASKRLIPVTLELGGKSPCIVDKDADIKKSARRIVWGKFINSGQTCVAPDYLYVHKEIKDEFLRELVSEIKKQFGNEVRECEDYPRIISKNEVERLAGYLNDGEIYFGGEVVREEKYISPTILVDIKSNSKILQEEIFGPILPVYEFDDLNSVITYVNNREKPLALYYFSEDNDKIERVLKETTSGGVTINDTVIHVASKYLPFGGVGSSGVGAYHGKASFDAFTHRKSVVRRGTFMELPFRFSPYKDRLKLIKRIMK